MSAAQPTVAQLAAAIDEERRAVVELRQEVAGLTQALADQRSELASEVRTRRLVVVDESGRDVISTEVGAEHIEFNVFGDAERGANVVVWSESPGGAEHSARLGSTHYPVLGGNVSGVELRAESGTVAAFVSTSGCGYGACHEVEGVAAQLMFHRDGRPRIYD